MSINIKKIKDNKKLIALGLVLLIASLFIINNAWKTKKADEAYKSVIAKALEIESTNREDRRLVENYINENIERLAPERVTLGRTWHMTKININMEGKTGTFSYTDGIKQGSAAFRFTKSGDNLISVGITKLK